jgi:two-component system CheB/CheR fusion protein
MKMSTPVPLYLIAIGASAGGMDDIHLFFDHTPLDGVSYIIVQHLSPDFRSRMVELLARHSKLKVTEAEENMLVESNQVYFIPNKKYMTIREGRLHLTEKEKNSKPKLTINVFLNSLAAERGKDAIAVILSGMGSDGSDGIKAIKKAGGMVIARNPEKAAFSDMPANAIATGAVDYVLDTETMPHTITDYVNNQGVLLTGITENDIEKKCVAAIVNLITDKLSLNFSEYKEKTILRRIKRRAAYHNLSDLGDYVALLKTNSDEIKTLAHDFLISVTSFFRDKDAFQFLHDNIIPEILKKAKPDKEIKFWVPGCATGEEAYSMAMLVCEQLHDEYKNIPVKIFATDIDTIALSYARKGIYSESITKDISPERIDRFFIKEGNKYRIKPEIRKMVIFAEHDLVKNPPYSYIDLIGCRNLLIYMTTALQKKIFLKLHFGLKKDGYLFLGSSENIHSLNPGLQLIDNKYKIYKNTEAKRADIIGSFSVPALFNGEAAMPSALADSFEYKKSNLPEIIYNALISDLGEVVFCIDENNHVIQTFGDTTKYLLQKNFNTNLAELLPKPLNVAFGKAKRKALQSNEKASVKGIKVTINKSILAVNLQVKPLPINKGGQKILYVLLSSEPLISIPPWENDSPDDEKIWITEYTINLEEELGEVKEHLQAAYKKLDASLENTQAYNEELLSANEEMQSLIEELHTINADYQLKNKELLEINDDLNNYFSSNQNGQLFVNADLLLTKFSPAAIKHINLVDTDIGRPVSNISTNIKFETIVSDIKKVIVDGGVITKEVEALNGKWYHVMTMPFIRFIDNKTDGAIISFNDITELKKIQKDLYITNKNLTRINADLDNFVLAASHDLLGPLSNIEVSINMLKVDNLISDPLVNEYLNIIDGSVKKFRTLINELSIIGKLENEMSQMKPVDLNNIIDEIKLSISDKIRATAAEITTELEVEQIIFSVKNLRSLLYNVITNAIKYKSADRTPVLIISSTKENNYVLLSIKDNGIGIAKDKIDKIFNIYSRIQTDVEGQGIGLYLAKKIVDAAGGYISVESEVGKGSTFNIYFKLEH